jgi:hypothetical protein
MSFPVVRYGKLTYPPLSRQMMELGKTIVETIRIAAVGTPFVPQDEVDRRLAICEGCDEWDADTMRCTRCGCWTKKKAHLAARPCERWMT